MKPIAVAILAAFNLSASAGWAVDLKPQVPAVFTNSPAIPKQLKAEELSGRLTVIKPVPGPKGFQGWLVKEKSDDTEFVVFSTVDGKYVVAGALIDSTGKNLTVGALEKYARASPAAGGAGSALAQVNLADFKTTLNKQATSFYTGADATAKPLVTVNLFIDARCGWCHRQIQELQPYLDTVQADVRFNWIPVAMIAPDSLEAGAAMLALAATPADALNSMLPGAKAAPAVTSDANREAVKANTALFQSLAQIVKGGVGTPTALIEVNGELQVAPGMMPIANLQAIIDKARAARAKLS